MRDCVVSVLMSPDFLYRIDLVDATAAEARPSPAASKAVAGASRRPLSTTRWRAG